MKKYLHYDAAQFSTPRSDAGVRQPGRATPSSPRGEGQDVLDLSAKSEVNAVTMVTNRKWNEEQDAVPLDLSGYGRQEQEEALDLTKPAAPTPSNGFNQSRPLSHPSHQSIRPSKTPPSSRHSKSPVSQSYSLLQAALNSNQPDAGLVDRNGQSGSLLDFRSALFGGVPVGDATRGIKPFSAARPLGITVPHMAFSSTSGAIIQGTKPIAITTPQPHNPPVNTKSQSVSDTTVSVTVSNRSISSTCNQDYFVSQSNYSNAYPGQILSKKLGVAKAISHTSKTTKSSNPVIERYMLQNPDGFPGHLLSRPNIYNPDILSGFSCTQCPKVFKTKAAMKLHMTVHKTTEERQYGCQVCQRRFLHRHHLVVHQRKHSGEKPFKCNACSKTFMAIFLLHKHLRKHARETGTISDMSVEQLKQLQEQKLIAGAPQPLTYSNVPPVSQSWQSVIVRDDEESQFSDKTQKEEVFEEKERKVGEVIGEINKDPTHSGVVLPIKNTDAKQEAKCVTSNFGVAKVSELGIPNDKDKTSIAVIKEPVDETEVSVVSKDNITEVLPEKPDLIIESTSEVVNVKEEIEDSEEMPKLENEVALNPFPEYTSDDEVELDCNTGELIVKKDKKKTRLSEEIGEDQEQTENRHKSLMVEKEIDSHIEEERIIADNKTKALNDDFRIPNRNVDLTKKREAAKLNKEEENSDGKSVIKTEKMCEMVNIKEATSKNDIMKLEVEDSVEASEIELEVQEAVDDLKHQVCSEVETNDGNSQDSVKVSNDSLELKSCINQSNIFEKLYESVKDTTHTEKSDLKGRKGKKKGRKVKCEICSRTFHSSHYLLLHMAVHKRNPMLQSLKKAKANQMKAMGFVNKTNVACEVCNKVFKFQKSLNSHMRVHSEKLIERKLYRKAFRDFVSGRTPQSVSKAEKRSRQSECSESQEKISSEIKGRLSLESSLSDASSKTERTVSSSDVGDDDPPIKIVIGADNVKRYLCHACDNTYTTKQKLRLHALIHKDNCFLCDICGKSFFRQLTLEKHISTHKLPRPHVCDTCKKSFIHRSSLMRHKSAHQKPVSLNPKHPMSDINFELKMRDTYSMLQEERLHQIQRQLPKSDNSSGLPKYDPLDLTVRIKSEEQSMPPVLSPANISTSSQPSSWNLSPPLITEDPANVRHSDRVDDVDMQPLKDRIEMLKSAKLSVKRKSRTESGCSESDVLSSDGNMTGPKKSRKTRVYQTSCRVCKEAFPNVMMLKSHMAVHNTVETHLYECHICRHRFTQSCSLLRHLKTSCQENRMKCVPCNKTFHRRNTFEQHMRLHEGGPSNLDQSFYDKRKDEAEVKEERESDIENNNSTKTAEVVVTPLTVENVTLFDKANGTEARKDDDDDDGNETDSDAQTYLYAEGEIHSRLSDLSDCEGEHVVTNTQNHFEVPQDLTKNNMTLNLLSAVCSELRNAEKEEEQKRIEMEEKQKELETIEILANLKRGAMQKSIEVPPVAFVEPPKSMPVSLPVSVSTSRESVPVTQVQQVVTSHHKTTTDIIRDVMKNQPLLKDPMMLISPQKSASQSSGVRFPHTAFPLQRISSAIEANLARPGPVKIPTVVQEVTAVPEPPAKKTRLTVPMPPPQPKAAPKESAASKEPVQMKSPGPPLAAIHERLSLLMKAQVTAPQSKGLPYSPLQITPSTIVSTPPVAAVSKPQFPLTTFTKPSLPCPKVDPDVPQDLTVKKTKLEPAPSPAPYIPRSMEAVSRSLMQERLLSVDTRSGLNNDPRPNLEGLLMPRSEFDARMLPGSMPIPPPLVSVYQCDICPKVVYNKFDLHLHRVEHAKKLGIEVLSGKKPVPKVAEQTSLEKPTDFAAKPGSAKAAQQSPSKPSPPIPPSLTDSLDLSIKRSEDQSAKSYMSNQSGNSSDSDSSSFCLSSKTAETLSLQAAGSDSTDNAPSPSAVAAGNLDQLRQELRHKIFSRRKSQGLEDLKVEFKQPEPTELTEEERLKLLYRRECNRQAAQRSRMRKKDLVDNLLEELQTEEVIQCDLRRRLESLMAEKNMLLKVLEAHLCVRDKSQALPQRGEAIYIKTEENDNEDDNAERNIVDNVYDNISDNDDNVIDMTYSAKKQSVSNVDKGNTVDNGPKENTDNVGDKDLVRKIIKTRERELKINNYDEMKDEETDSVDSDALQIDIEDLSQRTDDEIRTKPKFQGSVTQENDSNTNADYENFVLPVNDNEKSDDFKLFKCDNGSDLLAFKKINDTANKDFSVEITETVNELVDRVELTIDHKEKN